MKTSAETTMCKHKEMCETESCSSSQWYVQQATPIADTIVYMVDGGVNVLVKMSSAVIGIGFVCCCG